jgi:hypothetical protein
MPEPRDPIAPPTPRTDPDELVDASTVEGVRQQRRHIRELDGEDPLRGGVAD